MHIGNRFYEGVLGKEFGQVEEVWIFFQVVRLQKNLKILIHQLFTICTQCVLVAITR